MSVITKSGTNDFHGSVFWFHNDNALNSCSNPDKRAGLADPRFCSSLSSGRKGAPFRIENQMGGGVGGPIWRNRTFFFGSVQRWTDRQLGSGTSISGVPTDDGKAMLQSTVGSRPQFVALLQFVPGASTQGTDSSGHPTFAAYCSGGGTLPSAVAASEPRLWLAGLSVSLPPSEISSHMPISRHRSARRASQIKFG